MKKHEAKKVSCFFRVKSDCFSSETATFAEVKETVYVSGMGGSGTVKYWRDEYYCEEMESHLYFKNGWKTRSEIRVRMV